MAKRPEGRLGRIEQSMADRLRGKQRRQSMEEAPKAGACHGSEVGKNAALTSLLGRKAIYEKRTVEWDELLNEGAPPLPPLARFAEGAGGRRSALSKIVVSTRKIWVSLASSVESFANQVGAKSTSDSTAK